MEPYTIMLIIWMVSLVIYFVLDIKYQYFIDDVTIGYILKSLILSMIPVYNTIIVCLWLLLIISDLAEDIFQIVVFKKKKNN